MKYTSLFMACSFAAGLGISLGHYFGESESSVSTDESIPTSRFISSIPKQNLPKTQEIPSVAININHPQSNFKKIIQKTGLNFRYENLTSYFPNNKNAHQLLEFTTLMNEVENPNSEESIYARGVEGQLLSHSEETWENLKIAMDKMPDDYFMEKQFLIQFSQSLNIDKQGKIDFFSNQIVRPQNSKNFGPRFTAAVALHVLANTLSREPSAIYPVLKNALDVHQKDKAMQALLINQYSTIDHDSSIELKREYNF